MQRLALLLSLAALVACGDNAEPPPTGRGYDAEAYHLEARFDWERSRLIATETITLVVTDDGRTEVELDSEVEVQRVRAGDRDLPFEVDAAEHRLRVDLTALAPGAEPVTFTVDYEAPTSRALIAALPRPDDPAQGRMVYCFSEPIYGSLWLIAKHDPADRARFSVAFTVGADEDAIANGTRLADGIDGDRRVVRYQMDQPLPTYLMAFAAGDLVHVDRETDRVPLSLWHRRGLAFDPDHNLDMVADAMQTFERLLGPYPFDTYAVVLVPGFPAGGMEHATITFNHESSGIGNGGFELNAHELAHHWFGDWVTMRTYDDVWVKEGMATLLAAEATRARRDREGTGRLFGNDFAFWPDDRIVDTELSGIDKYTSGPYTRAAWLITQIRGRVGEEAFWRTMREVLAEHALDSIDGESFLRSFTPELDEETIARALASLDESGGPELTVEITDVPTGTQVRLALTDPRALVLEPTSVTVVDAGGTAKVHVLGAEPITVVVPPGGYLAPDEWDRHAPWGTFRDDGIFDLAAVMVPAADAAWRAFETRSPSHQEAALQLVGIDVPPDRLAAAVQALDSDHARFDAMVAGCLALSQAVDPVPYVAALTPLVREPPELRGEHALAACGRELAAIVRPEMDERTARAAPTDIQRLEYLMSFDYGDADSLTLMSQLVQRAPTLRLRDDAIERLVAQAGGWPYTPVSAEQLGAWQTFLRERLVAATVPRRFHLVWQGVQALHDVAALPDVAAAIRRAVVEPDSQVYVICQARELAAGDEAAWQAFAAALAGWGGLAADAAAALADASACPKL